MLKKDRGAMNLSKLTYQDIRQNTEINAYITMGDKGLGVLGYTDHSQAHAAKVAEMAGKLLTELGYSEREVELAKIAGYMHDIGNAVNRNDHAHSGAVMAFGILRDLGMEPEEAAEIVAAIGNHDEHTGTAVSPISAALILADKTDVRRNRVRNHDKATFDIHDRVNYAAVESALRVDMEKKVIQLDIKLDETICSMLDYFEIFLERMLMCRRAAEMLKFRFKLTANENKVL